MMLGEDFLVVPVLDPGVSRARANLPAGEWVHVWSGRVVGEASRGTTVDIEAPIGKPAFFHRRGSASGEALRRRLAAEGLL